MFHKKKGMITLLFLVVMFSFFHVGQAFAYLTTSPYKLNGGISNRTFYIGDPSSNWSPSIRNGVNAWNTASTSPDIQYSERAASNQTLDFYVGDFGNVDWCGVTFYRDSNGSYINYGGFPNQNWNSNWVRIQEPPLSGCPALTKKATAAHEMGHSLGLRHTGLTGKLMSQPTGSETPTSDDISGINELY